MSFPTLPDLEAAMDVTIGEATTLLLLSVAFEELGLAHLINAEAEKVQSVLGTLYGEEPPEDPPTVEDLIKIDDSVNKTLKHIIKDHILLEFKLEEILDIFEHSGTTPSPVGSAWSVGTDFGTGNAQYATLLSGDDEGSTVLGLGKNYIDVGSVEMQRDGNILHVTISTDDPYLMDEAHLYVSNVIPVNSNPGGFPYQYTVTDPVDYFYTHTFDADISGYPTETLYVAAHAHILR